MYWILEQFDKELGLQKRRTRILGGTLLDLSQGSGLVWWGTFEISIRSPALGRASGFWVYFPVVFFFLGVIPDSRHLKNENVFCRIWEDGWSCKKELYEAQFLLIFIRVGDSFVFLFVRRERRRVIMWLKLWWQKNVNNLFHHWASMAQQEVLRSACAFAGNRGMAKSGFEAFSCRQHITQQENVQSLLCLSPFCLWVCA